MRRIATLAGIVGLVLASADAAQAEVVIDTVTVGDPGNAPDTRYETPGYGNVDYVYNIGKYEVTAGQYTEFLNAVADDDIYGLYNTDMWSHGLGCKIEQTGSSGSYSYSVSPDRAVRPVNYVSLYDALRFANWMHNGQLTGAQDTSTTEDGAYDMSLGSGVVRKAGAQVFLPSEDEWYKAAYYKGGGVIAGYWDYPTSSDSVPGRDMNEGTNPGNNANYFGDPWPIDSPYYTTVVGEFEWSDSPYGTFNQGGNVGEWNEATIGSYRGLRGGSFNMLDIFLPASFRGSLDPASEHGNLGFRVSEVPEHNLGDLNCDGWVNNGDIDPFVVAITQPGQYPVDYPDCDIMDGDCNGDGWVNNGDIDAFVDLLNPR